MQAVEGQPACHVFPNSTQLLNPSVCLSVCLSVTLTLCIEFLKDAFNWKQPSWSLLLWVTYVTLCYHPHYLLYAPFVAVFVLLLYRQYYRISGQRYQAGDLLDRVIASASLFENMTNIQKSTGDLCDAIDFVLHWLNTFLTKDPSKDSLTWMVMCGAVSLLYCLTLLFDHRFLFAFFGSLLWILGSKNVRIVFLSLLSVTRKSFSAYFGLIQKHPYVDFIAEGLPVDLGSPISMTTYENQRWWFGLGWVPNLLSSERPLWSDEAGLKFKPKNAFLLPPDYHWTNNWTIDPIPILNGLADEEGWEYGTHSWAQFSNRPLMRSVTRRRKWVRVMERKGHH